MRARLPEEQTYVDRGCEVAPKCLECPLSRCRYEPNAVPRNVAFRADRDRKIEALREQDKTVDEIAAAIAVSRRTVFRSIKGRAA